MAELSLVPLSDEACQAYFSNRVQLGDLMEWVLKQIGPSHVEISTFSTSEEFIRRVVRLKDQGQVLSCSLYCDIRAARKTLTIYSFIKSVFDEVYLCQNHSKVILFRGSTKKVVVITSQNQTRGDRFECGVISSMENMTSLIADSFLELKNNSYPLDKLL